jgi:hypothetical protein
MVRAPIQAQAGFDRTESGAKRVSGERRRSFRKSFTHPVNLLHPDGKPICGCTMRDISETGARLKIGSHVEPDGSQLPPKFILAISKSGNVFRRCEVVWRKNDEIGVRFAGKA